jgi:hypothetical protein
MSLGADYFDPRTSLAFVEGTLDDLDQYDPDLAEKPDVNTLTLSQSWNSQETGILM